MTSVKSPSLSKTPYIDLVVSCLPPWNNLKGSLSSLCSPSASKDKADTRWLLDTVLRFALGGPCQGLSSNGDGGTIGENEEDMDGAIVSMWTGGQAQLSALLAEKLKLPAGSTGALGKRSRDDEDTSISSKKSKIGEERTDTKEDTLSDPLYTLHSVSFTSPIRKKADLTITSTSIRLTKPSHALETPSIPLSSLKRAFLLANKNKNNNKPRWSVVLLSEDMFYDGKGKGKANENNNRPQSMQIIFTVDATTSSPKDLFTTTTYASGAQKDHTAYPKGTETAPLLRAFLSYLSAHITFLEPRWYIEAYRAAKDGFLFFMDEGILWGDGKPCMFFAVEDIAKEEEDGLGGGVRTLSATGRAFSVFVRRIVSGDEEDEDEDAEIDVEETEFAQIDSKEQEKVTQWVRQHRHLFGRKKPDVGPTNGASSVDVKGKGKEMAPPPAVGEDDEDESDSDFEDDSDSDGGEPTSSESEDEKGGGGSQEGGDNSDEEEEGDSEAEEEELTAQRHPLMRPGAMPRMSKAAMEAVVGMVEEDMGLGGIEVANTAESEDELDD